MNAALPAPVLPNPPHQAVDVAATPTLTWSRGAVELLVNGNFESGELNGWQNQTIQGFGGMEVDDGTFNPNGPDGPTAPLEGSFCATLQSLNFGGGGWYEFSQVITLPSGLTDLTLAWSQLVRNYADDFSNNGQFQYFRVEVRNSGGTVLETLFSTQPGDVSFGNDDIDIVAYFNWQKRQANLDAYAGQTIRIVFATRSQLGNLNVRLDRMSLTGRPANAVNNEVYLSVNPLPGPGDLLGATTGNSWPLEDLQPNRTYYWRVNGRQGADFQNGPVWQFRTGPVGDVDRLVWDTPATASAGMPFAGTLTALDERNNTATAAAGPAQLSAVSIDTSSSHRLLGQAPFTALNQFEKTTAGYSFTPSSDMWVESVRALGGGKISIWTDTGLLLASQAVTGPNGAWKESNLESPLSLLAGRTYRIGVFADVLTPFYNRFDASPDFAHGTIHQSYTEAGDAFPTQPHPAQWWMVDLEYVVARPGSLPVSPESTSIFSSGVWSGSIAVSQVTGPVAVLATLEDGSRGYSDVIAFEGLPDSDHDGIPDDWESAQGLNPDDPADAGLDGDGDGHTNLEEYWAGTDPNDPQSVLRISSISHDDGTVTLRFTAQADRGYSVLYTDSAGSGAWTKLADVAAEGQARLATVSDAAPASTTRFYQVVTPRQ